MTQTNKKYQKEHKVDRPMNVGDGFAVPQAVDLEEAVLGAILIDGECLSRVIAEFSEGLFYNQQNKNIARAIILLYRESQPIDILTVTQKLKELNILEETGGAYYVSSRTNRIAAASNIEFHLRNLQQEYLKRNLVRICSNAMKKALTPGDDVFDVYAEAQADIDESLKEVMHYESKKVGDIHFDILKESIDIRQKGIKSGVPAGLMLVDNLTNGWQKSDLIILAGRPSMGKTACAVSMAMYPALDLNIPIAIFSLEMSSSQLVSRMQSNLSGVNVSRIVKKQLDESETKAIHNDCVKLETAPIFIDDTPNISLLELKSKARKLVREEKVELIIIDYLQLMRAGYDTNNREQEIAAISRGLKAIAKELDIPVIALSQLSRAVEARGGDKKPGLSDLRESGQIEQDADMVVFCYRPEYYGIEQYEVDGRDFETRGLFMLLVAKHRNGELGEIPLKFIHEQTKVTNHSFFEQENRTFVQPQNVESNASSNTLTENNEFLSQKKSDNEDLPF